MCNVYTVYMHMYRYAYIFNVKVVYRKKNKILITAHMRGYLQL